MPPVARSAAALGAACHPLPSAAVTGFCAATAAAAGVGAGRTALLAAAVLAGQLSVGWGNDYLDAARDVAAGRPDKPVARGAVPPATVGAAAVVAATACLGLSLGLGARPAAVHLVAVAAAWSYNLWAKFTRLSPLPYAVAFGLVPPVLVTQALPGSPLPAWPLPLATAALGLGAHFANTIGDTEADARTGVRGLPQRIGPAASAVATALLLLAGTGLLVAGTGAAPAAVAGGGLTAALTLLAVVRVLAGRRTRATFRLVLLAVAPLVVAFVLAGGSRLTS